MGDKFIEISDIDSIKKALENAEIDYEELSNEQDIMLETEENIRIMFSSSGQLLYMEAITEQLH